MEELKMQNGLLLQLINSKNRQNQILFQQYEQLAQDNQQMQAQIDRLKSQSSELKRGPVAQHQEVASRHSAFDVEIADLKKKCGEYVTLISGLKRQLQQKGGAIIFLQNQLKNAKLQAKHSDDTEQLKESLKKVSERLESKERSLSELTQYMNEQAEKINDLTKAGIIAIENYQGKLEEKEKVNELLVQQIAELTKQLQQNEEKAEGESDAKLELAQGEKLKELQTIILSKEQSITELSQFLEQQSEKVNKLEADLTQSNLQALQEQINSMKAIVEGKEQSIVDLSEFLDMLSAKNKEMEEKIQQMESNPVKAQVVQENIDELKEKMRQYQSQNESLLKELSENTSYMNQIQILRARLSTKEDEMAVKDRQIASLQQNNTTQAESIEQLNKYIKQMQKYIQQFEDQQQQYSDQIKKLTGQIEKMNLNKAQKDSTTNQQNQSNLQAIIKDLQETLVSKTHTIAQLSQYMNEQSLKIEELEAQLTNTPMNNSKTQQLQQIIKSKETALAELTQYLQEVVSENMELTSLLENTQVKQSQKQQDVLQRQQNDKSEVVAQLQAKIAQYEGYLNEKEEEMTAMMEVMDSLQSEIQSKNEEIEKLQQQPNNSSPQDNQKIKELEAQMQRLTQSLNDLQNQGSQPQQIDQLQQQYQQVQLQQKKLQKSQKLAKAYKQQLQEMQNEDQPNLNAQILIQNEQQIQNNEKLTVLQVIEQILVYSEQQSDISSFMGMIEVLKRSYLRQNQCILKENSELKDSLNRILQINNVIVQERERFTAEIEELKSQIQEKQENNREMEGKMRRLESNYQQEIKQLRKSISGLKDQSPIIAKQLKQEGLITISKLEDQIIALKQQNHKKQAELQHLRAHSNKKFVKELNNLLDSCTVNKDEKDWKELEEQLERANTEKQEALLKCKEYETEIVNLEKRCIELTMLAENLNSNLAEKMNHIEREKQASRESDQQEEHKERLIVGFQGPLKFAQEKQSLQLLQSNEESFQRLKTENEELHGLISDKNFAINELEETLLSLEKGYNSEIMGLRKNIAQLQGESIALRRSLYQANPNGVDIGQLIKDSFSQSDKDTEFFRPTFPLYTQHLFDAQPMKNNQSYYSEINRARSNPKRSYQRYFPADLSMGEKFMGRKCRQASPFGGYREEIRANGAWTSSDLQRY